jgi:hypothetical protein
LFSFSLAVAVTPQEENSEDFRAVNANLRIETKRHMWFKSTIAAPAPAEIVSTEGFLM